MTRSTFSMATLPDWIGKELGVSSWIAVNQQRIDTFAECTGDHQWIHVDRERAVKESPFGGPIAHGFLTLSLLSQMGTEIGIVPADALATFNYGLNKVRFIAPVLAGARVRGRATLVEVTDQGEGRKLARMDYVVEIEGGTKPALIAESLALLIGKP